VLQKTPALAPIMTPVIGESSSRLETQDSKSETQDLRLEHLRLETRDVYQMSVLLAVYSGASIIIHARGVVDMRVDVRYRYGSDDKLVAVT
jgi:hypothetical protein